MKKIFIFLLIFINIFLLKTNAKITKQSHLNTGWYPQEKNILEKDLDFYITTAKREFKIKTSPINIKSLIVPHAGFYYSGLCAATAYQTLLNGNEKNKNIKNVIILSPSHSKAFSGIAIPKFEEYKTILGNIQIDQIKIEKLKENQNFKYIKNIFDQEHAIEIQLPFLQKTIENFSIIPLIVGYINENNYDEISKILKSIIDPETLIVISSDFIHFGKNYNYTPFDRDILDFIRFVDSAALEAIGKKSFSLFNNVLNKTGATICGQNCIKILLKLLEEKNLGNVEVRLTCYYTSAQLSKARNKNNINIKTLLSDLPDKDVKNSVSYAGLIFTTDKLETLKDEYQLTEYEKKSLIELVFQTIKNEFEKEKLPNHLLWPIKSSGLQKYAGVFVTLDKNGSLRGCIGRIISDEPIFKTVQEMAKIAAFNDNRFKQLEKEELDKINISISILTKPKEIKDYNEIKLGQDGIILKKQTKSGFIASSVFLPKVPTGLGWNLQTTLEQLSLKAGLEKDAYKRNCNFEVFQSFEIKD